MIWIAVAVLIGMVFIGISICDGLWAIARAMRFVMDRYIREVKP